MTIKEAINLDIEATRLLEDALTRKAQTAELLARKRWELRPGVCATKVAVRAHLDATPSPYQTEEELAEARITEAIRTAVRATLATTSNLFLV